MVIAQQNLFNIPSSEITVKNKLFFQQQFNINENIQSNTNFCYGLGWNMELGFNIAGLQTNQKFTKLTINNSLNGEPLAPLGLITFQKAFDINRLLTIGLGTQFGTNLSNQKKHVFADFTYLNSLLNLYKEKLKINFGIFYGDKAVVGEKSELGYMYGFETKINKKIHLVADHIAGKTPIGVNVVGFIFFVQPNLPLSFGYQIPNSKTNANTAYVFELTYVPKEHKNKII